VAVGDFDGDGFADVLLVMLDHVQVFRNRGDGTFAALGAAVAVAGYAPTAADLDGDGRLDVVLSQDGANRIAVLQGAGDGTFRVSTFASGSFPNGNAVGDVTGDGLLDIAVANRGASTVGIHPGTCGP
jgi:hypothetical protein